MSLLDRDYMNRREPSVFRSAGAESDTSLLSILFKLLTWLAALFILYKAFHWWDDGRKRNIPLAPTPAIASPNRDGPPSSPRPIAPTARIPAQAVPNAGGQWAVGERKVTKCVMAGKVTFTDQECPQGAKAGIVTVNTANVGTVAPPAANPAVQISTESTTQPVHQPPEIAVQETAALQRQAECPYLAEQIKQIDAMARQPLSGQVQDDLSAQRKRIRSRQFNLKC